MTSPAPAPRAFPSIADKLSALGSRYEVAPTFPVESLRVLRDCGYHRRFAPIACGGQAFAGPEALCKDMARVLRLVGRGDLTIGRLFEGHVNAMLLFGWYGAEVQRNWLGQALEAGAWFGVWATEQLPGVRIDQKDAPCLTGEKMFASGAGGLDYALVTAVSDDEERRLVSIADRSADGRQVW